MVEYAIHVILNYFILFFTTYLNLYTLFDSDVKRYFSLKLWHLSTKLRLFDILFLVRACVYDKFVDVLNGLLCISMMNIITGSGKQGLH